MSDKKTTKAKKAAPAKPAALPTETDREYGAITYSTCRPREEAIELIEKHGYKVIRDNGKTVELRADSVAYRSSLEI